MIEAVGKDVCEAEKQVLTDHGLTSRKRRAECVTFDPLRQRGRAFVLHCQGISRVGGFVAEGRLPAIEAQLARIQTRMLRLQSQRIGSVAMEDDVNSRRPDLVSRRRNGNQQRDDQRSKVSEAHRLSQSAFVPGGAGMMCTDLISHTPFFGSAKVT